MATLATRVISGKGLLRLDTGADEYKKAKVFTLYVDVVRRPINEYINLAYNQPESRYATIRLYRGSHCIQTLRINVLKEAFDFYLDPAAQVLYAVQCAYQGLLESFVNLGTALGAIPISVTDNIKDWNHIDLMWDEAKVVCYGSTAVQLSVRTRKFDLCPEQEDKEADPPPPPPPPPPEIPPEDPLDDSNLPVSPPYDEGDDDGDSVPYEGDSTPAPTLGCWKINTIYTGVFIPPGVDYVVGLETDSPAFRVNGSVWELYDAGTGRTMYTNWVNTTSTPSIVSAEWQEACESETPGGIPPV